MQKNDKIKLIALDMDGTLLDKNNQVSKRTSAMLKELEDKGIKIALVTGRVYVSALAYKRILGLNAAIASTNGALVFSPKGERIYKKTIDKKTLRIFLDMIQETDFYFHLYPIDGLITSMGDSTYSRIEGRMPLGHDSEMRRVILPIEDLYDVKEDIYKIIIITDDNEARLKFRKKLSEHGIFNSSSWNNNIEITNERSTKEHGVKSLLDYFDFSWDNVMAFGDNENDIPMLRKAKRAFIMGNASTDIKAMSSAEVVGKNYEEGVYHKLKEYFF